MIRRMHIYLVFAVLMAIMSGGIFRMCLAAQRSGEASSSLVAVVGTAGLIVLGVSLALFVAAWNVRNAPD